MHSAPVGSSPRCGSGISAAREEKNKLPKRNNHKIAGVYLLIKETHIKTSCFDIFSASQSKNHMLQILKFLLFYKQRHIDIRRDLD
jgi:hypothetical protein